MVKLRAEIHVPFLVVFCLIVIFLCVFVTSFIQKILGDQAKNQFRLIYSDYTSALNQTVSDFNGEINCYLSADRNYPSNVSGCSAFYRRFIKNMDVTKYCPDYAQDRGCIPLYKKYDTRPQCAGYSENMMNKYSKGYTFSNISSMLIFTMPTDVLNPIFAIDVNGPMQPNKAGYDLFSLVVMRSNSGSYYFHTNVTYCLPVDKGGIQNLTDIYK